MKATSAKLAAAGSMGFTAIVDIEHPSKLGPPGLSGALRRGDAAARPLDKLRVLQSGGTQRVLLRRRPRWPSAEANPVAIARCTAVLEAALQQAQDKAAIYYPFTDLLLPDLYKALTNKVLHAFYIGPSGAVGGGHRGRGLGHQ
ncbi:MAG: DUF2092 domain-containing protein [Comamonadaceae bacterium]|nr:DUF2092 domain-containing protein [Comamonadaceae bacterium]